MRAHSTAALIGCLSSLLVAWPVPAIADPCAGVFTDVDSTASYCSALEFIKSKGVTLGCTGTTFCPDQYVTRAQMALFMQRLARGGTNNILADATSAIGGGDHHTTGASSPYVTIAGGYGNFASGAYAAVGGGNGNASYGYASTVAGGLNNRAGGAYSFVAGRNAFDAERYGSFIWADASDFTFQPSVNNFFAARATGGVGFTVAINGSGAPVQYCNLLPGTPSWQCTSDRNAKDDLVEADGAAVLAALASMPVYTYSMKGSDPAVRSMGPTAQDFHAAFGLGMSDTTIAGINLDGVALAAIKGLKRELDDEHAANSSLREQNVELARRLDALERAMAR